MAADGFLQEVTERTETYQRADPFGLFTEGRRGLQRRLRVLSALVVNQLRAHSRPWLMSLRSVRGQPPHLFCPRITRMRANPEV